MENYQAFLKAQTVAEYFLIAHAKSGPEADAWRNMAMENIRGLAKHLGFELVPVAAPEQKDAA